MRKHHSPEQVTKLYELVEQEAAEGAFYQESWDLRRLVPSLGNASTTLTNEARPQEKLISINESKMCTLLDCLFFAALS